MINYCFEIIVYQGLFIGLYQLLKSEPLFKINRIYLLTSLLLSLLLPLLSFYNSMTYALPQTYVEILKPIQIGSDSFNIVEPISTTDIVSTVLYENFYLLLYVSGIFFYGIWFLGRNKSVFKSLNLPISHFYKSKPIVFLPKSNVAFSFINRIYIGENIPKSQRKIILEHEYHHLQQKHSWDMIILELFQFMMWFNPLIYIYKKQLRQVHEFEADRLSLKNTTKTKYINTLLNRSFDCQNISFVNSFNHHTNLKKRITMLHKSKLNRLKYVLIIPMLFLAIFISCADDSGIEQKSTQKEQEADIVSVANNFFSDKPSFFDRIKEKPDLNTLLKSYNIEVKNKYTKSEQSKLTFIIFSLKFSSEYQDDLEYKRNIDKEINRSKGLLEVSQKLEEIMKNNDVKNLTEKEEQERGSEVPFALLDLVPHPVSCHDKTDDELKKCVSAFIANHVNKNFKTGIGAELGLTGQNRVVIQFKIDKTGKVTNAKARAEHPKLEEEAKRVIESLPQMIPGEVNGEKVSVLYGLPINFIIN